ncbi:methionine adenosyltransferase [Calothrix sp. NIES-4071]|nr:methionine adenosyltransferase [Calothrix sp. NIES-4071]BAZ63405.1 methionine adenosyltransferase [Calothrix sp. NIES-4105]
MKQNFMFSSESVTEGHPDKLCDQISDAIVDKFLQRDPYSRVVAECAVATAIVFIAARFESDAVVDFTKIARQVIKQVGYNDPDFNANTCSIITSLKELPSSGYRYWDARQLSDEELNLIPVKDQVTVFGFACNQTPTLMPLPIWLAHSLARRLTTVRTEKILPYIAPDGKTQVGVEYRNRKPYRIHSISILASQNQRNTSPVALQQEIKETIIDDVFKDQDIKPDNNTRIFIDFDQSFTIGGPSVHSGLTGRKNGIDTYGEYSRHSGAALSGKDPTRIDRVGAYAARYAAKNIVAARLALECEVQVTYSMGLARPVSIQVETFGTGKIPDADIAAIIEEHFDFRLGGIIRKFNLRALPAIIDGGFYRKLAAYGHVGRDDLKNLPWEEVDMVGLLKK